MIYRFGDCELDPTRRVLRRAGTPVDMEPRVFDLLRLMVEQREQFVARETFFQTLWPGQTVTDASLSYCLAEARKAVGDSGRAQRVIKTIHGRGYRFVAAVQVVDDPPPPALGPPAVAGPTLVALPGGPVMPVAEAVVPTPTPQPDRSSWSLQPGAPTPDGPTRRLSLPRAEQRQLTVLWCRWAVVASTDAALNPEVLLQTAQEAQQMCDAVIAQFEGRMAQQFVDGFTAYFGHPQAHEDDARRAVRAGLAMIRRVQLLAHAFYQELRVGFTMQIGIHTGVAVIGRVGQSAQCAQLAVGNTPQTAAHLVSLAQPNTVVISAATLRLVEGYVVCEPLGCHMPDTGTDMLVPYRVLHESAAQSRLEVGLVHGLTPFVGREHEGGLLQTLWAHSQAGQGQVVLIRAEAGMGKSRLVQVFHAWLADTPHTRIEWRCSAYDQHSALHPVLVQLQDWLQWQPDETPDRQIQKLEAALQSLGVPLLDAMPVWTALFALPMPAAYTALAGPPERLKQHTQAALLTWLVQQTAQQPVCLVVEDAHWLDPSTLELLELLMDQVPLARLLVVVTCRPEFVPAWAGRPYVTQLGLTPLAPEQTARMITQVVAGKALPPEVQQQLVANTNGVPLFVEELTKMVLESGLVKEAEGGAYALAGPLPPLAIPATLYDSLMARLDRQEIGKAVAQLGATVGREFSYALLQAIAPLDDVTLQDGLARLVRADILHQRGLPPQAQYLFKHALIQDAAYHSLLQNTRQQYHQRIAQTLETCFPETRTAQPELVAYHYTAAGCRDQAVEYWQQAGQRALERSAYREALAHLSQGLTLLTASPTTTEQAPQELRLHMALGTALMALKGQTAPEVMEVYARAHALCQQIGGGLELFPVLLGLWRFYGARAELQTARDLATTLMQVAERAQDPTLLLEAHMALGNSLFFLGKFAEARMHFACGMDLCVPQRHRPPTALHGRDPGVICYSMQALTVWKLGYPRQARVFIQQALSTARELGHPLSLAFALCQAATLYHFCQEPQQVRALAEEALALAAAHELGPWISGQATIQYGWALVVDGQGEAGLHQIQQGLRTLGQIEAELPWSLFQLVDSYRRLGQGAAGLRVLRETVSTYWRPHEEPPEDGERHALPEMSGLYWLQGECLVQIGAAPAEVEDCLVQALNLARCQEARSDELRAAISLSRLWHAQGKDTVAQELLSTCYTWFTEGWETPDLQEAQALLARLSS